MPNWHDDIGAHFFEAMSECDALLLGRRTWQIHGAAFEPMAGDSFADTLNDIRKYVVSTTLESATARGISSSFESMAPVSKNITLSGALMFLAAMAASMEIPVPQKTISPFLISLAATIVIISRKV